MTFIYRKYQSLSANMRTALMLCGVVMAMGGLAWAAVPLYDWFCRVTGFGGVTARAEQGADRVLDQRITVFFDASTDKDMAWVFKPKQKEMSLRIGETGLAFYEAYNPTDYPIAGTASYNVVPYDVGSYFVKIECFCFFEQVLQPGERIDMPVTFFVDPEMLEDERVRRSPRVTLSYTFHKLEQQSELSVDK